MILQNLKKLRYGFWMFLNILEKFGFLEMHLYLLVCLYYKLLFLMRVSDSVLFLSIGTYFKDMFIQFSKMSQK